MASLSLFRKPRLAPFTCAVEFSSVNSFSSVVVFKTGISITADRPLIAYKVWCSNASVTARLIVVNGEMFVLLAAPNGEQVVTTMRLTNRAGVSILSDVKGNESISISLNSSFIEPPSGDPTMPLEPHIIINSAAVIVSEPQVLSYSFLPTTCDRSKISWQLIGTDQCQIIHDASSLEVRITRIDGAVSGEGQLLPYYDGVQMTDAQGDVVSVPVIVVSEPTPVLRFSTEELTVRTRADIPYELTPSGLSVSDLVFRSDRSDIIPLNDTLNSALVVQRHAVGTADASIAALYRGTSVQNVNGTPARVIIHGQPLGLIHSITGDTPFNIRMYEPSQYPTYGLIVCNRNIIWRGDVRKDITTGQIWPIRNGDSFDQLFIKAGIAPYRLFDYKVTSVTYDADSDMSSVWITLLKRAEDGTGKVLCADARDIRWKTLSSEFSRYTRAIIPARSTHPGGFHVELPNGESIRLESNPQVSLLNQFSYQYKEYLSLVTATDRLYSWTG